MDDHENTKPYLCNICELPILSSPSYTCSLHPKCEFFLHKACADQMLEKLNYANHDPSPSIRKHTLSLVPKGQNFVYKCTILGCQFELHPLVAVPVEIKTKHKSHNIDHQLVAVCRETLSRCDACGEEHKGFFFCCFPCNFWIHQECALLPSFVKLRSHFDHPFFLTYSLPSYMLQDGCCLCKNKVHLRDTGVYFCGECDSLAHLRCAKASMEDLTTGTRLDLIQLPFEGNKFPSSVISKYLESHPFTQLRHHDELNKHSSMLELGGLNTSSLAEEAYCDLLCDICTRPIDVSSPFHKFQLQTHAAADKFHAHDICSHHLRRKKFFFGLRPLLRPAVGHADLVFRSIFTCFFCRLPCNGFCYYMDNVSFCYFFDIECLSAPRTINHASHPQHVLFRFGLQDTKDVKLSCCSRKFLYFDVYSCTNCKYYIHLRCALLPKWTSHKFDEHLLELITNHDHREDERRFCEVCEEDIDQQLWYYGCGKCEYYFHIDCIPAVGYLSKVKFGEALVGGGVHDHPVTLTRMLTAGQERCGYCGGIIRGRVDEMAFRCSECDFWIHFSCARDSYSACSSTEAATRHGKITKLARTRSKIYFEVEDAYFKMFSPSTWTATAIKSLTM